MDLNYRMSTLEIIENTKLTSSIFKMALEGYEIAKKSKPGQFVSLKIGSGYYPLLRRPMSVYNTMGNRFEIIYNVRGLGTRLLSEYKCGDGIDVLGPLGIPFEHLSSSLKNSTGLQDREIYLVAGGMGIAPLYFQYKRISATLIFGARDKEHILPKIELDTDRCTLVTEDGSLGRKGIVTDYLPKPKDGEVLIACGPIPMLKAIKQNYSNRNITCILSLEARMGCGYGSCLSCAVKTRLGYRYVCKDGPAFLAEDLIFD